MASDLVRRLNPPQLYDPTPHGYGHISVAPPGAALAFIAGQGGEDGTGALAAEDFGGQVQQAFANLLTALTAAGAKPGDVVKLVTLVVDHDQSKLDVLSSAIRTIWGDQSPAQTLIPVPRLALDGMLFEVDAVAVVRQP